MRQNEFKSKYEINKIGLTKDTFYYCMVISFFLIEIFKEDMVEEVVAVGSYASTVGRKALDLTAKIVKTGGQIILRVTEAVMEGLRFSKLWERCQRAIPIKEIVYYLQLHLKRILPMVLQEITVLLCLNGIW